MKSIQAVGDYVIVVSTPKKKGDPEFSESGIFLGEAEKSELPEYLKIHSIGPDVPPGVFKVGDITALPVGTGNMRNVPHPDVIEGIRKEAEIYEKFTSLHWKAISVVYN